MALMYDPTGKFIGMDPGGQNHGEALAAMQREHNYERAQSEGTAIRGQLPKWGPGEFEEWKAGKMNGTGTAFGRMRQRQYDMRQYPGMFNAIQEQYNKGTNQIASQKQDFIQRHGRAPTTLNPAVRALLGI